MPWRRAWQPTPVLLPGESHGQRSLEGYSPWDRGPTRPKQLSTRAHPREHKQTHTQQSEHSRELSEPSRLACGVVGDFLAPPHQPHSPWVRSQLPCCSGRSDTTSQISAERHNGGYPFPMNRHQAASRFPGVACQMTHVGTLFNSNWQMWRPRISERLRKGSPTGGLQAGGALGVF